MKIKTKRGARRIRNQRVVTRRFVVTDYTGCPYITAGKRYEVLDRACDNVGLIVHDWGRQTYIITPKSPHTCAHLDGRDWQWATI